MTVDLVPDGCLSSVDVGHVLVWPFCPRMFWSGRFVRGCFGLAVLSADILVWPICPRMFWSGRFIRGCFGLAVLSADGVVWLFWCRIFWLTVFIFQDMRFSRVYVTERKTVMGAKLRAKMGQLSGQTF